MSTTFVPKFDTPVFMTIEQIRESAREWLVSAQGDADKAGDVDDATYYQGWVDALSSLLTVMTFPRTEEDARTCQHDRQVWLGHECGECERDGYAWKDES